MTIEYRCPKCNCDELDAEITLIVCVNQGNTIGFRTTLEVPGCRFDPVPDTKMICIDCNHKGPAHTFRVALPES